MALKPGETLNNGQFEILGQLGRGGFGFVYHARDTYLGEDVAIKELIPGLIGDELLFKRFLAEAKATIRLRHESIVGTRQIFPERDNAYIVMDYLPGGSLEDRLRQGPLSIEESIRIAAEVCDALDYAHRHGVIHCDLKPANILFTGDGTAKLADFGIAYVSEQALSRSWQTPAGFVAGTLPYMSPEQAAGVRNDPRLDLYALGAMLYRMLTGRTYLDFDTRETPVAQAENIQRICGQPPQPPSAFRLDIPRWLDQAVLKVLAKLPDDRYPSAAAFRAALLTASRPPLPAFGHPAPAATVARPKLAPGAHPTAPHSAAAGLTPSPKLPPSRSAPGLTRARTQFPTWTWLGAGGAVVVLILCIALTSLLLNRGQSTNATPSATTPDLLLVAATPSLTRTPSPTSVVAPPATPSHTPTRITAQLPTPLPQTVTLIPSRTPTPLPTSLPLTATLIPTRTPTPSPRPIAQLSRIAFASNRNGNYEIYVMNADGSAQTRLTKNPNTDSFPAWSPDGKRIAFTSDRNGNYEIYVMNADGSAQTRLTNNPADDGSPAWSPIP